MIQESRGCNALTSLISLRNVSTTCGSGWVGCTQSKSQQYGRLIVDPPATAGGTDIKPNDPRVTRLQCLDVIDQPWRDGSTTCGSGWVGCTQSKSQQYRRLIVDPPATQVDPMIQESRGCNALTSLMSFASCQYHLRQRAGRLYAIKISATA